MLNAHIRTIHVPRIILQINFQLDNLRHDNYFITNCNHSYYYYNNHLFPDHQRHQLNYRL